MRKKLRLVLLCLVIAGVAVPAAAGATGRQRGCEQEFEQASAVFDQAFIDRDFETFMSFIADDAVQIDYLGTIFDGKAAIADFTTAVMRNAYTFTHELLHQRINRCESAFVVQDTVFAIPSAGLSLHLEDTVSWVREHGDWKIVLIQNTQFAD